MAYNGHMMTDEELEAAISTCNRRSAFSAAIMVIAVMMFIGGPLSGAFGLAVVGFMFLIVGAILLGRISREKKELISDNITREVLREVFNVTKYSPEEYVGEDVIKRTGLIPTHWNRVSGSDYFEGSYRGVQLACSDLHVIEETTSTDADGNTTTDEHTLFKGQWIILHLNKNLRSRLIVREKDEKLFGRGYYKQTGDFETENGEFNRKFRIETTDGHEAFFILTPHFMEHIMKADDRADAKTAFCFMNDEVHFICHNNENLFEVPRLVRDVTEIRNKMRSEAGYITNMIDSLLENEYLFGTEN